MSTNNISVPIIDIQTLVQNKEGQQKVGEALKNACSKFGFFYIKNHGVSEALQADLEKWSQAFFALPLAQKMEIEMAVGGKAWRGYFPVNGELTSGKPDLKEGLYLGTELGENHPKVKEGTPLHGANLFPKELPFFKAAILEYIAALTQLGHQLMEGLSLSLDLNKSYFADRFTTNPLTLFRIFHYPAPTNQSQKEHQWGVGEHTDYGVLTILKQDDKGGLQIFSQNQWIPAPYIPNTFICNIGDMLERMTGGYYRSTPHRVLNESGKSRLSYPFFFDPNFAAIIEPIPLKKKTIANQEEYARWDGASVHNFEGTYGEYVLGKVAKVFPQLRQ